MNNITKIKPFMSSGALVDYAIDSVLGDDYPSMAFIGYGYIIAEILGTLFVEHTTDIDTINMDECTYNDLYCLLIDEDFIVSVIPIKKDNGEYIMINVDIQFISDEVSTKYVQAIDDEGYTYQIFTLGNDFEEEMDDIDGNIETDTEIAEENINDSSFEVPISVKLEVTFNGRPYDKLSDDEKQLFDLMMDG